MGQNREAERAEAYATALLLTLSGGFQDAYTYCLRGRVFANAQTGNVVLFSAHLLRGRFGDVLRYLIPIAAFVLGTCLAEGIRLLFRRAERLHWRQTVLLTEILVLFTVGFIAEDDLANALVSFSCAMQVQSFRKMRGDAYASTMCIGNLRSGAELLCAYAQTRDSAQLRRVLRYGGVLVSFAVGAGAGSAASLVWGAPSIWCSCALLIVCFLLLFPPRKGSAHPTP